MREIDLPREAEQIEKSEDRLRKYALERGKDGVTNFYPDDSLIGAYRTGLNLVFQKNGWGDLIAAEEVVTGDISLQQGFFNRLSIPPPPMFTSEDAESARQRQQQLDNYRKTLRQFKAIHNAGIEIGYRSYLRGSLIAIRALGAVTKEHMEIFSGILNPPTAPKDSEQEEMFDLKDNEPQEMLRVNFDVVRAKIRIAEDYLQSLARERESLERCLKDPTYPYPEIPSFSPREIGRLELLRRLRQQRKI